uniref:Uncharacterized protein n=1 Tax=Avena sativa TaxID=4498 RepID=A0ACD5TLG7_AVESA
MNTLYYLALLQGVIFCYRFICAQGDKRMAERAAFGVLVDAFSNYVRTTRRGCEVNPSFAKGRNLITDGIDMIGSTSPVDCILGVKVLYTAIFQAESKMRDTSKQCVLMKHLVLSASSSTRILQKLLEMLHSRGLHGRETRHQAAKIVGHLAFNISLEQFPQGIQHISSLIGTFGEYSRAEPYQRDCILEVFEHHRDAHSLLPSPETYIKLQRDYKTLLLRGQHIIWRLASDENNCRVISCTADLVSKIMAPVCSDLLDHTTDDHGAWSDIVEGSLAVMSQLTSAAGETGAKLRHEISSCKEAISTMVGILECDKCNEKLQRSAIWILTQLYMDAELGKEDFVAMLVDMFTHDSKPPISVRAYAGGTLSVLCFHGGISCATVVIQTSDDVVHNLTKLLVDEKNMACRQAAAEILEHLCTHYTKDDERLGQLKEAMRDAMPKVIGAILGAGAQTYIEEKTQEDMFAKPTTELQEKLDEIEWKKGVPGY